MSASAHLLQVRNSEPWHDVDRWADDVRGEVNDHKKALKDLEKVGEGALDVATILH